MKVICLKDTNRLFKLDTDSPPDIPAGTILTQKHEEFLFSGIRTFEEVSGIFVGDFVVPYSKLAEALI